MLKAQKEMCDPTKVKYSKSYEYWQKNKSDT